MENEKKRVEMKTLFKCLCVQREKMRPNKKKLKKLLFSGKLMLFNRTLERSNIYYNVLNELNTSEMKM
jgi:hypothetical protein